jgi:hypothetical protein
MHLQEVFHGIEDVNIVLNKRPREKKPSREFDVPHLFSSPSLPPQAN